MNLDDFLVPNSIASPAGITPSPDERSSAVEHAHPPAMPIQSRKVTSHQSAESLPVSSVPQPSTVSNRSGEFGSVPRRLRKTSIDERRVSHMPHSLAIVLAAINCHDSLGSDLQSSLLTSHRRHY
jgi:GATA-binding protein, other eukaryote